LIADGTHSDTTSERSVLDIDHVELLFATESIRSNEGADAGSSEGKVGVDDSTLLLILGAQSAIKRGPEHPQEDSTDHGKGVRVVDSSVVAITFCGSRSDYKGEGQAYMTGRNSTNVYECFFFPTTKRKKEQETTKGAF